MNGSSVPNPTTSSRVQIFSSGNEENPLDVIPPWCFCLPCRYIRRKNIEYRKERKRGREKERRIDWGRKDWKILDQRRRLRREFSVASYCYGNACRGTVVYARWRCDATCNHVVAVYSATNAGEEDIKIHRLQNCSAVARNYLERVQRV